MTLQLELDPKTEAWIQREAARRGMASGTFALEVLRRSMPVALTEEKRLTVESFHEMLKEFEKMSENAPKLPLSAFTRETIYSDHD